MASATGRRLGIGVKVAKQTPIHLQKKNGNKLVSVWDALQLKDVDNFKIEQAEAQ